MSCDGGLITRTRICINNGLFDCEGEEQQDDSCNTQVRL